MNARQGLVLAVAAIAMLLGVLVTGCASPTSDATNTAVGFLTTTTTEPATTTTTTTPPPCDPTASHRPDGAPPSPGSPMPAGSYMERIQKRGFLIVGVDQNTLLFGYRNPTTGDIDGIDIAIARQVAQAILGDPDAIELRAVTTDQRKTVVQNGSVDMLVSQFTANCARRREVDLSTIYYLAHQKLLVRSGSGIKGPGDLAGRKVCATRGSTSLDNIHKLAPRAVIDQVAARTDCLVHFEEGTVDAITSDDTILLGFRVQDPVNSEILPQSLSDEPYAIATSPQHPEFGRFVNAVLDELRSNGELEKIYHDYLALPFLAFPVPQAPPPAHYLEAP